MACNCRAFTLLIPLILHSSSFDIRTRPLIPFDICNKLSAIVKTDSPCEPVRNINASNSLELRDLTPYLRPLSRGRSVLGISRIIISQNLLLFITNHSKNSMERLVN